MYTLTETAKMNGINPEGYPITRLIASESCCPGIGGRAADKRLQARCASHPPFRFAKRHTRSPDASRVPVNSPINEQASHGWRQRGRRISPDAYPSSAFPGFASYQAASASL